MSISSPHVPRRVICPTHRVNWDRDAHLHGLRPAWTMVAGMSCTGRERLAACSWAVLVLAVLPPSAPRSVALSPTVTYTLRLDPRHLDDAEITIRFVGAPATFHLAMKVHAEYDAKYWRYLSDMRVDGSADDGRAAVARQDSTLWLVTLPGGTGVVRYHIHIQPPTPRTIPGRTTPRLAAVRSPRWCIHQSAGLLSRILLSSRIAAFRLELDVPGDWQNRHRVGVGRRPKVASGRGCCRSSRFADSDGRL